MFTVKTNDMRSTIAGRKHLTPTLHATPKNLDTTSKASIRIPHTPSSHRNPTSQFRIYIRKRSTHPHTFDHQVPPGIARNASNSREMSHATPQTDFPCTRDAHRSAMSHRVGRKRSLPVHATFTQYIVATRQRLHERAKRMFLCLHRLTVMHHVVVLQRAHHFDGLLARFGLLVLDQPVDDLAPDEAIGVELQVVATVLDERLLGLMQSQSQLLADGHDVHFPTME